jgi:hypothetical protein
MTLRIAGGARAALIAALLANAACAGVIWQVSGETVNWDELGGPRGTNYEQALGFYWTLTKPYSGVVIQPLIYNYSLGDEQVFAWLTTATGPATGPENPAPLAEASIWLEAGWEGYLTLFAPIDLGPGRYYVILYGSADTTSLLWEQADHTAPQTVGPGVIPGSALLVSNIASPPIDTLYPPASGFAVTCCNEEKGIFTITGTEVPEPGHMWIALVWLLPMCRTKVRWR